MFAAAANQAVEARAVRPATTLGLAALGLPLYPCLGLPCPYPGTAPTARAGSLEDIDG